ncbi:energy transducer TonB family protein [Bartonella sp. CB169]|uniref:energy transducer TonB family protein n=1 Tax=Bartonella sp. CB169 TaxID=3112257 RepID=UPI00300E39D0
MNFVYTRQLLTLWIGAFICSFSLHVALGARFYFYSTGVSNGMSSTAIMLTFAQEQETVSPVVDTDLQDLGTDLSNVSTELEKSQLGLLEHKSEVLEPVGEVQPEELQHTAEKDDLEIIKSLEKLPPQKMTHKAPDRQPISMPKAVIKRSTVNAVRSSTISQGGDTAEVKDALLVEWLSKVQAQLEMQKKYVVRQRISRAKGTVKLEFRVHEHGDIFSSRVVVSAGDAELDRLAMSALQRVGSFPPPPPSQINKVIRISLIFS